MTGNDPEQPAFSLAPQDPLAPRGPWSFMRQALAGGGSRPGLELLLAWTGFFLLSNGFWALHLKSLTGWSSLPNYWGELLTARDLWELMENGGLKQHGFGPLVPLIASLCLLGFLWAGWRVQAAAVRIKPCLGAWLLGLVDAVLLGAVPIALVQMLVLAVFARLGSTGIQGLSWLEWVGGALVRLACLQVFFLQWWLCRVNRAGEGRGWRLGSWSALARHLGHSFLALWTHPIQWTALVLGGVVVRTGLSFLGLFLAWRWGGGTPLRVWAFLVLQVSVVVVNAWQLGWFLRLVALFGRHDAAVHAVIRQLELEARGGDVGSGQ